MKKRSLAILAGGMSLALLLSSCGPSSAPTESPSSAPADETGQQTAEEPVTITYCNFNASGGNEETLQKMYEAFHEEHPNITVEIETIAMDDYFTQMQTRVAGGTAPDCYELNIENFASYANKGVLAEISGVDLSRLDETALSAFNVDGKQYGLPGNFSNVVLVYNKDLFDQAGIDYPTADWTQDDVQTAAEAIRALGDDIYGYYQPLTYNEFYKVCAQFGGSLLNEDKTEFTINSPENVAAAQMMADRVLVSNVQPTDVQMGGMGDWDLFMSGRLGMIPTGIWAFQSFADGCDFNWDKVAILSPTWASVEPARSAPISLMRPIRIPPDFVTGSWNFPRSSTIFWISWAIRFTSPPHSCLMRPKAVAVGWSAMTSIRISLEQIVGELSTRSAACGSNPLGEMTRWLPYGSPRMVESPFCSEILYF